jgi:hypothetical protein
MAGEMFGGYILTAYKVDMEFEWGGGGFLECFFEVFIFSIQIVWYVFSSDVFETCIKL